LNHTYIVKNNNDYSIMVRTQNMGDQWLNPGEYLEYIGPDNLMPILTRSDDVEVWHMDIGHNWEYYDGTQQTVEWKKEGF